MTCPEWCVKVHSLADDPVHRSKVHAVTIAGAGVLSVWLTHDAAEPTPQVIVTGPGVPTIFLPYWSAVELAAVLDALINASVVEVARTGVE